MPFSCASSVTKNSCNSWSLFPTWLPWFWAPSCIKWFCHLRARWGDELLLWLQGRGDAQAYPTVDTDISIEVTCEQHGESPPRQNLCSEAGEAERAKPVIGGSLPGCLRIVSGLQHQAPERPQCLVTGEAMNYSWKFSSQKMLLKAGPPWEPLT